MSKIPATATGSTSPWHRHSYQSCASKADRNGRRSDLAAARQGRSHSGQARQGSPRRALATPARATG